MSTLVVQIVIQQWDKGQQSEADISARAESPDRYPVTDPDARYLFDHQVVLDQHGDDVMGNRIQYELSDDGRFIIDRFRFDLNRKLLEYIAQPDSMLPTEPVADLSDGWVQCRYQWRYKVYEGGFYYWLYEAIIVNAGFVESLKQDVFTGSEPTLVFEP
ncbi:hypothetical protein [Methylophaga sp.]|jgi:hypothetical protein|uniref:hypothetical protein n=1 Tax=Methylophaga sp. TaxID=2024840 RepID=UPI0013FE58F9|nr:hypothetical protein [Methylophaga sp.]MTI64040.1 hypothetical protein [Methylophaga sp.]